MSPLAQAELELENDKKSEELTVYSVNSGGSRSIMDSSIFRWVVIESNRFQEQLRVRVETQIQCQVTEDHFSLAMIDFKVILLPHLLSCHSDSNFYSHNFISVIDIKPFTCDFNLHFLLHLKI